MRSGLRRAFTLVEILIVVVILGILAAIIIPQFSSATQEAAVNATYDQLQKIRRAVGVYRARNGDALPPVTEQAGDPVAAWGILVSNSGDYMLGVPTNSWVGGANAREVRVVANAVPDTAFQTDYGWIFDSATGDVWAGGFDANDRPLPRP
jgi:general secretion pathway protein G